MKKYRLISLFLSICYTSFYYTSCELVSDPAVFIRDTISRLNKENERDKRNKLIKDYVCVVCGVANLSEIPQSLSWPQFFWGRLGSNECNELLEQVRDAYGYNNFINNIYEKSIPAHMTLPEAIANNCEELWYNTHPNIPKPDKFKDFAHTGIQNMTLVQAEKTGVVREWHKAKNLSLPVKYMNKREAIKAGMLDEWNKINNV